MKDYTTTGVETWRGEGEWAFGADPGILALSLTLQDGMFCQRLTHFSENNA